MSLRNCKKSSKEPTQKLGEVNSPLLYLSTVHQILVSICLLAQLRGVQVSTEKNKAEENRTQVNQF